MEDLHVPAPNEPGGDTWKGNTGAWKHGGGSFWQTGSYDPVTKLTYWGTGQPVPMYDPEYRPGDNLYTNSTLALDINNGKMKWYFQYTPGDFLDYDEIGISQLIDTKVNGEDRKIVAHFGRNGFFYTLDRTNGQFIEVSSMPKRSIGRTGSTQRPASPSSITRTRICKPIRSARPPGASRASLWVARISKAA